MIEILTEVGYYIVDNILTYLILLVSNLLIFLKTKKSAINKKLDLSKILIKLNDTDSINLQELKERGLIFYDAKKNKK